MKISVYGLKPFSELIKDGFEKLGHQTSSENVDLIYANDPRGYEKSLILKKQNPNVYGYNVALSDLTNSNLNLGENQGMIVIDDDFNTVAIYDPSKSEEDRVSNMTRKAFDTVFETGATRFLNAIKIHKKGNHYDSAKVVFNDEVEASDSEDEYY